MSKELDEAELLADIKELIDDYGRDIVFYKADETTAYPAIKISPPKDITEMNDDNIPVMSKQGWISASGLAFTPFEGQRILDETINYRITKIKTLSSGETTQAYRITFQR